MSNYRRALIPGATYFFTVVLEGRKSDLLIRQINALRQAYATTAAAHPF
jgi:putative transposase